MSFKGSICITDQSGSVALVPSMDVVAEAGADIDLAVVRAGMKLKTIIMKLSLVPTLTLTIGLSGNIRACFDAKIEIAYG